MCAATFAQYGGVEALTGDQACVAAMVAEFDRRRVLICERLKAMPGIQLVVPDGAFYVLPYVGDLGMDSATFAAYLLENAQIAVVPGGAFGEFTGGTIRISYANSYDNLEKAMDRMEKAVRAL